MDDLSVLECPDCPAGVIQVIYPPDTIAYLVRHQTTCPTLAEMLATAMAATETAGRLEPEEM